jgi:hypothetical protein
MRFAQRSFPVIQGTLPHTHVSRRARYAKEHWTRPFPGRACPAAGYTAACTIWLVSGPAYFAVVCGHAQLYGDRRGPVLLTLQRVTQSAGVSHRGAKAGIRCTGLASSAGAHHVLTRALQRSPLALLNAAPHTYGWCRTRWSCAGLALTFQTMRGITVSAGTMRRWLHALGWVWKPAKLGGQRR